MEAPYGSRINRLLAYVIDSWLILGCQLGGAVFGQELLPSEEGSILGFLAAGALVVFLNYGVLQGISGASLGKWTMNLQVVRTDGSPINIAHSSYRTSLYLLSILPAYAGYLVFLWSPARLCWHDRIAGTVVIRKGARYPKSVVKLPLLNSEPSEAVSEEDAFTEEFDLPKAA